MVDVSILIVNWNTATVLKDCLQAVLADSGPLRLEVIVIDNASRDGSGQMVRALFPNVTLVENAQNVGFARGCNQALALANGRNILLLNPDAVLLSGCLLSMVRFLDAKPRVGAACPRFLNPDGSPQSFYFRFPGPAIAFFCFTTPGAWLDRRFGGRTAYRRNYGDLGELKVPTRVDQPGAACLIIPQKVIDRVGFMDEGFPLYFNDTDLCRRLYDAGYTIFVVPEARAIHQREASLRQMMALERYGELVRGLRRYFHKHGRQPTALVVDSIFAGYCLYRCSRALMGYILRRKTAHEVNREWSTYLRAMVGAV